LGFLSNFISELQPNKSKSPPDLDLSLFSGFYRLISVYETDKNGEMSHHGVPDNPTFSHLSLPCSIHSEFSTIHPEHF